MVLNIKSFKDYESIIQNNNFLKELGVISNKINEISLKSKRKLMLFLLLTHILCLT